MNESGKYCNKSVRDNIIPYGREESIYYSIRIIIVSIVSTFIVVGNTFNIAILSRKCRIPRISRIFLLNLSVSDFCVGLISCLPTVYSAITEYWPYGAVWCQISGIFHGTSCAISIWSLSMVAVDRYLAICKPMSYVAWKSSRKAYIVIGCLWVFAFGSFTTPCLTKPDYIYYQFGKVENICGLFWEYKWFCIMTTFYIPILSGSILVYTNVKIIRTMVTRNARLNEIDHRSSVQRNQGKYAIKLLLMTSSIFFVAWGPYVVDVLLYSFIDGYRAPEKLRFFLMWIANSNSFMNVITLSVIYRCFRKEVNRLMRKYICCCKCSGLHRYFGSEHFVERETSDRIEMRLIKGISIISGANDMRTKEK